MSVTIGQRGPILSTLRHLENATNGLSRTFERLSSGKRINSAADDAAGLAVSSTLNARSRIYDRGYRNLSDGISALSVADEALGQLTFIVERQRELAEQAANGILGSAQRAALDQEAQALRDEYNRIIETTRFNNISLLSPGSPSLHLQGGIGSEAVFDTTILQGTIVLSSDEQDFNGLGVLTSHAASETHFLWHNNTLIILGLGLDSDEQWSLAIETYQIDGSGQFSLVSSEEYSFFNVFEPWGYMPMVFEADVINSGGLSYIRISAGFDDGMFPHFENLEVELFGDGSISGIAPGAAPASNQMTTVLTADFTGNGVEDTISSGGQGNLNATATFYSESIEGEVLNQSAFSLLTQEDALEALDDLKELTEKLGSVRGRVGAYLSRIESASSLIQASSEQFLAAASRISDADVAVESAEMIRYSIQREAATAVLAQANILPELALELLDI